MSGATSYEEARVLAQLDSASPYNSYIKTALLPNEDSGNNLTEIVSGSSFAVPSGVTWNVDGSVSSIGTDSTNTSQTIFDTNIAPSISFGQDFMFVFDFNRNGNTKGNNHTLFSLGGTSGQDRVIVNTDGRNNVDASANIDFTTFTLDGNISGVQTNLRKVYIFRWKSATGVMEMYYDGALQQSIVHTISNDIIDGNDPTIVLGIGGGLGDALYMSTLLAHPTGAFTQAEVDSLAANPYQLFSAGGGGGLTINPSGVASSESFGIPTINLSSITISVSSITSSEIVPSPQVVTSGTLLSPLGIGSAEVVGLPNIQVGEYTLQPVSIDSEELLGSPLVSVGELQLLPTSISSGQGFGTPSLVYAQIVQVTGIGSKEAFGLSIVSDGESLVIPLGDRVTYQQLADYLRSTGRFVSEQNNDVIIEWLRSELLESGQFNDLFMEYWSKAGLTGAYNDRWKKWRS